MLTSQFLLIPVTSNEKKSIDSQAIKLLTLVMGADNIKVKVFLDFLASKNEAVILKRINANEESKREWKSVSSLEYAAWSGDSSMLKILLSYLSPAKLNEAIEQLQGVLERKATAENGEHLAAYYSLIKSYEEYDKNFDHLYATKNWEKFNEIWLRKIGKAQFLLPLVGLQEFCDEKPFYPLPTFDCIPQRIGKPGQLFNGLGINFTLYKGKNRGAGRVYACEPGGAWAPGGVSLDASAIRYLCKVRKKELYELILNLKQQVTPSKAIPLTNEL